MARVPTHVQEAASLYAAWLRERFSKRLHQVTLFGSYARGEAVDRESDVDVAVILDDFDAGEMIDIANQAHRIGSARNVELKPLILEKERYEELRRGERRLAMDIEREGIPL